MECVEVSASDDQMHSPPRTIITTAKIMRFFVDQILINEKAHDYF